MPLALKIAPDLDDAQIRDDRARCAAPRIDGIIATNTTVSRDGVEDSPMRQEAGGLSGAPLRERSDRGAEEFSPRELKGAIPLIGVGGILSGADATEKLDAGASLVQLYTGLIYRGPGLVAECVSACLARSNGRVCHALKRDRRRPDRRSALHRLHALHRRLPGGRDRGRAGLHAHGDRGLLHRLRAVPAALPRGLHRDGRRPRRLDLRRQQAAKHRAAARGTRLRKNAIVEKKGSQGDRRRDPRRQETLKQDNRSSAAKRDKVCTRERFEISFNAVAGDA